MVNRRMVVEKLAHARASLEKLKQRRRIGLEELLRDTDAQDIVLRNLQVAIQACIDIGSHVISDEGWEIPGSLADIFEILHEKGVIPLSLMQKLISMAGFRNIVIHEYARIDIRKVREILKKGLRDFDKFMEIIVSKYRL